MDKSIQNGNAGGMSQYETPFADTMPVSEYMDGNSSGENFFSGYMQEVESPFARTYETAVTGNLVTEAGEEFVNLISELNDSEFTETLYELANEVEDTWRSKVSDEIAMGNNYLPFAIQQSRGYFAPLANETEAMIDRISAQFSGDNLADMSASSIESFFSNFEFSHRNYTPVQEQFFGNVFNKIKSVVKSGINLAKKGINAVGKILPINIVLKKIKGLIRPLLDKVLKFAIGKLPPKLQPYAQTFAKKFLNLETGNDREAFQTGLESIQSEFDHHIAQLVFSPGETDAENAVINYEQSIEKMEREYNYETGSPNIVPIEVARQQFINDLKNMPAGESPAPAIEKFLPAAILALQPVIKMAISIIGRQKVINFLAGLLAKLVAKYVPAAVAKPLAASIIDIGMNAIGFETYESGRAELAYEAIANTIEETVRQMNDMNEAVLNDPEEMTMQLLEAFETAAADNFPAQYIKEELRNSRQKAVWVRMPRNMPVTFYKKFTHIYDIVIQPKAAGTVKTFRDLPLANFLRDKYGLDPSKPIKAKVHLYELNKGARLSMISKFEKLPGLNSKQPKAWVQLLPLTKQAASLLVNEASLGKDQHSKTTVSRFRAEAGQRFYYLEIEGARLRLPHVTRTDHRHEGKEHAVSGAESRSADIQAVINFIRSEIKLNYYFSEEDAKIITEKLNNNDLLGAAMGIRQSVKTVLHDILIKNISSKVKVVHEALPELFLENYADQQEEFAPLDAFGKAAGKEIISTLVERMIGKVSVLAYEAVNAFFKARAAEFKEAQAQPQDGVTIKIIWSNITGMKTIRTIIGAIKGNLPVGDLSGLSLPGFPAPDIKVEAGKKFD